MEFPLHIHQVDHHLVDVLVGVVPHFLQQAAEGVLDRAGGGRVPVDLDGRQMADVFPTYIFGIWILQAEPVVDQVLPGVLEPAWQVDGVLTTLLEDGYDRRRLFPVENKTVVTASDRRMPNNKCAPCSSGTACRSSPLPGVEWTVYKFQSPLLKLNAIFPEGSRFEDVRREKTSAICRPSRSTAHDHHRRDQERLRRPVEEVRHYAHEYIHEVMVDLMYMQRELHPSLLAVMDGTVMGDGAGPRTMVPRVGNLILASADQVALDAIAARIMGSIRSRFPYLRMCRSAARRGRPEADRDRRRHRRRGPLDGLQDQPEPRDLGRPADPLVRCGRSSGFCSLAPRRLGAVRLERLPRPPLVSTIGRSRIRASPAPPGVGCSRRTDMAAAIRVRFAPSPTGHLHVGGARTALFNWLLARHHRGTFILRIEDTDRSRSTDDNIVAIVDALRWLGLDWDEGPPTPGYRQTERLAIYASTPSDCSGPPRLLLRLSARAARPRARGGPAARRDVPVFRTLPRSRTAGRRPAPPDSDHRRHRRERPHPRPGHLRAHAARRLILVRTNGTPTYNFCVVVDDVTMSITHVVRGDDHLSNTPKQILCYEALDYAVPEFAHASMILGKDRSRLSKRHGATSVQAFRDAGTSPTRW